MVEIRPPITLEDLEVAGSMPDPVKLDTCNYDHCVSQATEQVVRSFEPRNEKTCLWGFRPVKIQTGLLSCRD